MKNSVLDSEAGLLSTGGNPALLNELVAIFLRTAPAQVERMNEALRSSDLDAIAREVHGLKGSAAAIGVWAIHALASDIEEIARSDDVAQAWPLAEKISAVLAQLESEYSQGLKTE